MQGRARTTEYADGIVAVDTEYVRPLQDASHLIVEGGLAAFVDNGTNDSVPLLLDALRQQKLTVGDVDFVFLTHIHLDHAGGAGLLMQSLPNARCVVHPRGAPHMIEPSRLVAGTEAVYGIEATREMYGEIKPMDASRVVLPEDDQWFDLNGRALQAIYTEGHALHHYCLYDPASKSVFTGDSFGVSYRELDNANGAFIFPTSTPTHFDPDAAHEAIDRIMACRPKQLYLTHFSRVDDLERLAADMHECIDAFRDMALAERGAEDLYASLEPRMAAFLLQRLYAHGFDGDDEAARSVLSIDIELNTRGLISWLHRLNKQGQ